MAEASTDLERVDDLIGTAESLANTVDAASRTAYLSVANPVIKTVALRQGHLPRRQAPPGQGGRMIPKRVFWLTVGAVAGAGASVRAQRAVKRKVAPYTPEHLPGTIVGGVALHR